MAVSTSSAFGQIELVGTWDGLAASYADVWGDGDYAYLGTFGDNSVAIVDISNPASPSGIEYVVPPPNNGASAQDVKVAGGLLFVGLEGNSGNAGVHIVDVRNPMSPVPLVDIDITGYRSIHNTFYDNGFLYLADSGSTRIGIVDLRDLDPDNPPAGPITEAHWIIQNVGTSFVHDITVQDGRLYAAAWDSGVWIYDVTDVANTMPELLGSSPGPDENTHSCWPTADGAYVVTGEERTGGGVLVYRITENPGSVVLTLTDSFALPEQDASSVHNQLIIGNRLYDSWYQAGVYVHDIDPVSGALSLVGQFDTPDSVWGVYPFLGPNRVLASERSLGLYVLEVTDPDGDLDGDGLVGITDLLALLAGWGPCPAPCPPNCRGDLDDDCTVGITDLLALLANWS